MYGKTALGMDHMDFNDMTSREINSTWKVGTYKELAYITTARLAENKWACLGLQPRIEWTITLQMLG